MMDSGPVAGWRASSGYAWKDGNGKIRDCLHSITLSANSISNCPIPKIIVSPASTSRETHNSLDPVEHTADFAYLNWRSGSLRRNTHSPSRVIECLNRATVENSMDKTPDSYCSGFYEQCSDSMGLLGKWSQISNVATASSVSEPTPFLHDFRSTMRMPWSSSEIACREWMRKWISRITSHSNVRIHSPPLYNDLIGLWLEYLEPHQNPDVWDS